MREITVMELDLAQRRDPMDVCLDIWSRWEALLDFEHTSGYANAQDTKEFMRLGEAMDVMIDSLPRHQWWAIRKAKGKCLQWIFKEESYADALMLAKEALEPMMRKNVYTRVKFD